MNRIRDYSIIEGAEKQDFRDKGQCGLCGEDRDGLDVRFGRVQGIHGTHGRGSWDAFFAAIEKQGLSCDGNCREIYHKWVGFDSKDNVTELQICMKK